MVQVEINQLKSGVKLVSLKLYANVFAQLAKKKGPMMKTFEDTKQTTKNVML